MIPTPSASRRPARTINGLACGLAPSRRSGFILVVLLVVLMMIAFMAIAYLGTIRYRTQEIKAGRMGNIDAVVSSVGNAIQGTLGADYPFKGSPSEPYDFPWTDAAQTNAPYSLGHPAANVERRGFTLGNPNGDDAWLASSAPENGRWPHLSNLAGSFLDLRVCNTSDLARINPDSQQMFIPTDIPSANLESDVSTTDPRLVDADGDGIGDAFWFYPSVSQAGDRRYVAAVRIEDLSAKLNANTALPLRAGGAYAAADKGPLGISACDLDLSAAVALWPGTVTDAKLAQLVDQRWGSPADAKPAYGAGAPMDYLGRQRYFAERACRAGLTGVPLTNEDATLNAIAPTDPANTGGRRFGASDEVELRWRNGINRRITPADSPTQLESVLGLRTATAESTYTDVPAVSSPDDFFRLNPRCWFTCFSGECLEQKGTDAAFATGTARMDVNMTASETAVYDLIFYSWVAPGWFNSGVPSFSAAASSPCSLGIQERVGTATSRTAAVSDLLAATMAVARGNMEAYRGNQVAQHGQSYALAPFPVLTEAYFQAYHGTYTGDPSVANGDGTYQVPTYTWGNKLGYCLEFSNPYATPAKICKADGTDGAAWAFHVTGSFWKTQYAPMLSAAQAANWPDKDEDGDCVLLPGHKLLVYYDSTGTVSAATPAANLAAISGKVNALVGGLPGVGAVTNGGAADANGRPTLHAALGTLAANTDDFDTMNTKCLEVQVWASARWAPMAATWDGWDYAPFYLTVPLSRKTVERSPVSATWATPAQNTPVGIVQVSARTWGLAEGLDLLQCRPARQNKVQVDYYDTGYYDKLTTTTNTKGLSLVSGAVPADLGDAKVSYNRAFNAFDSSLLSTLGTDDKGLSASAPANTAGRASIKGDSLWFATNNWYWDSGANRVRYRLPHRLTGLADMARVALIDFLGHSGANRGPALDNKNQGGTYYTDSDVPHSLYQRLHDQSGETGPGTFRMWADVKALADAGHSPLDITRFHPWTDPGTFAAYDATRSSRNVPWGWLSELVWSSGYPGLSNAVTLDASTPPKVVTSSFIDGNNDGRGIDAFVAPATAGNGLKDWNLTEVDWQENMAYGRLNLNTAPVWLLEEALPIKDASIRHAMANLIVQLRANAAGSRSAFGLGGTRADADKGTAYLSELIPAVANAVKNDTFQSAAGVAANWPTVPAVDPVSGRPNAAKPASITNTTYSYVGDKDLRLNTMVDILGPLWQTLSPRSDYFAAHILVQGYPAQNFSSGVEESRRVLIIYRRTSTKVEEITRYQY